MAREQFIVDLQALAHAKIYKDTWELVYHANYFDDLFYQGIRLIRAVKSL